MSRGVNKWIGIGNCGQDPEIKALPNGGTVATVSIGIGSSWKDKNTGQKQERTEWVRLVFFNKLAEIVQQYVTKGSKIYVEGELRTRSYEKDGQTHYVSEIVVSNMQMLDSRNGGQASAQSNAPQQQPAPQPAPQPAQQQGGGFDNFDDDIPFANPYKNMEFMV